jgi:hypothetical protein
MPAQSSQSRARGFTPLFRGLYSDQQLRVSDAERQAVADRLAQHFSEGRLDQAELDERVGRAMSARTRADLSGLLHDLPDTGAPAVPERPRRRRGHPVLLVVLLAVLALAAANTAWAAVPWLWLGLGAAILLRLGFIAAIVLIVLAAVGRFRPGRDR